MIKNRNKTIGVFVCNLPEYFQRTLCGTLADEAVANGYNLVVFSAFGEYDNNQEYINGESNLLSIPCYDKMAGIVLCLDVFDIPGMAEKLIEQVKQKASCPVISIRQKREEFISVLSDDKKAIMSMVDHLVDVHKANRIYYLSGPSYMHDIRKREDGFREIVKMRNIPFKEKYTNKDLDINAFYGLNLEQKKKTSYVQKNIWNTHNILYYSDYKTEKFYPDLISFNIPHYLESFPKLKRREFYEIFIEYKTLLKICVNINKNIKLVKEGIDFTTFFSCNPQMNSQGKDLALKIFNSINTLNSKYINWEEYINGLLTIKSRELNDKLDLFLKIIDSDGNGNLSFDEVYSLSIGSLTRTLDKSKGNEDDEVVMVLADYFAKLIFQLVGTPIDQEIPIEVIKQKICEGGKAAGYLEMFICADNFT